MTLTGSGSQSSTCWSVRAAFAEPEVDAALARAPGESRTAPRAGGNRDDRLDGRCREPALEQRRGDLVVAPRLVGRCIEMLCDAPAAGAEMLTDGGNPVRRLRDDIDQGETGFARCTEPNPVAGHGPWEMMRLAVNPHHAVTGMSDCDDIGLDRLSHGVPQSATPCFQPAR